MSSELRVDRILPVDGVPTGGGGGIIQIKQALKTDAFSTSSTSFTDITGLSVTLTPKFSTSKVFISFDIATGHTASSQQSIQLVRQVSGSDTIINACAYDSSTSMFYVDAADSYETWDRNHVTYQCIDSPATTSAVNYRLRTYIYSSSQTQYVNRCHNSANNTGSSTLTVMEISA
tara:strand:- start:26 stop:550 length:525 start_codon:yes stop_codon:yes gene_type:complete